MLKHLKKVLAGTLMLGALSLGVAAYNGIYVTDLQMPALPAQAQNILKPFLHNANVDSTKYIATTGAAKVRRQVRDAAVEIVTPFGRGSGTLFKVDSYHVVVTAAHVLNELPVVKVKGRNGESVYGTTILTASDVDMAVLLVPAMNSRKALEFKPKDYQDIEEFVGTPVTYTGFPSHHDLLTIDGTIASEEDGHLLMHSYAWPGASGSGVFDMKGKFIGVVRAVDVGLWSYQFPPQLVEDMVWIAPSWGITKKELLRHLKERGSQ